MQILIHVWYQNRRQPKKQMSEGAKPFVEDDSYALLVGACGTEDMI